MHDRLVRWCDEEISPDVMSLVRLVADAHRAGWRIRHLRPNWADVSTLAQTWLDRGNPPLATGVSSVVPHDDRNWSQGRLGLVRHRIVTPQRFGEAIATAPWAAKLTDWDVALVAGDHATARDGYLQRIHADPADLDAWTGLALALHADGSAAAAALLRRPELVLAVHSAIRAAGQTAPPVALASWLGSVP